MNKYNSISSVKRSVKFKDDDSISQEEAHSKVSNEGARKNNAIQSNVYKKNTTFLIRLEENKKIIEENKRKAMTSPKRFVIGGKQTSSDSLPSPKTLKSPKANNWNAVTVNKIRRVTKKNQKPPVPSK